MPVQLILENLAKWSKEGTFGSKTAAIGDTVLAAMEVAKQANVQYLRVDRYCIIQDAAERYDQDAQTDRIYGNALFTIAAADGQTANWGLGGVTSDRIVSQVVQEVRPGVKIMIPLVLEQELKPVGALPNAFRSSLEVT